MRHRLIAKLAVWVGATLYSVAPAAAAAVSLGVVFRGERVSSSLPISNSGTTEVFFLEASSDCPCLAVHAGPFALGPGQSSDLPYEYQSDHTGRFVVHVAMRGTDKDSLLAQHTVTGFVAERSWIIRAAKLVNASDPEVVLVDLRSPEKFGRAKLPRSFNVQPFALRRHVEWKHRPMVLLDEGYAPAELLAQVASLRSAGFDNVRALEGGLTAWVRQGGRIEGTEDLAVQAAQIEPVEFIRSQPTGPWRVIEVTGADRSTIPGAGVVARWQDLDPLLGRLVAPPAGSLPERTLVVAPDIETYAQVERRFSSYHTAGLFYLRGGAAALEGLRALQAATVVGPPPAITTQSRAAAPPHRGGCGVCPH